ncbi:MAG: lysylphosphatidylglycerol synthase transmembrane domain-containing protein [Sphaerobacter sp.]|nr:lysylphosphatidylglycerol synthase transmembrane domain-containing protein [Sphaerobacter sp.]
MGKPRVWLGFAVSIIFLIIAFRGQDLARVGEALRQANYWLLPLAILLYGVGLWVRCLRWSVLLRAVHRCPARELFPVVTVGFMANNLLPLRAGEVVRAYLLTNRRGVPTSTALATIAVEKVFDGLTMLAFMLVASLSVALTAELWHVQLVAGLLFGGLLVLLALLTAEWSRHWLLQRGLRRLPARIAAPVGQAAHTFLAGLGTLRRRDDLLAVVGASLATWLLEAAMYAVIALSFGLSLSPAAVLLVTAVANLATLIPASPGYVGPFEAGVLLALAGAVTVPREVALSYAIAVHAALYFPVTAVGLYYWWRESLSWRTVQALSAKEGGD